MMSVDDLWMLVCEKRAREARAKLTYTTTDTGTIVASDGRMWGTP